MALFNFGKKKKAKEKEEEKKSSNVVGVPKKTWAVASVVSNTLIRPRVTEKATELSERGIYVFEVRKKTTKGEVSQAVQALFKVAPVKIRMVPIPQKTFVSRLSKSRGVRKGGKKVYVYLKKGDRIEIV